MTNAKSSKALISDVPVSQQEQLSGVIEIVTFHSEETGFCVLKVRVKSHKTPVAIVGYLPSVSVGASLEAEGTWIHDRRFGQQFKASSLQTSPPTTTDSIEKYLSSGLIKGVGEVTAKKLTKKFGSRIFEIIDQEPERLQEVPGIGQHVIDKILESWADQKAIHKIMLFLHANDISTTRAVRIYKTYGHEAIQIIRDNPYRLARDIRGIGFLSADKVAEKLGIAKDSLIRARAGLTYTLQKAVEDGHCGLPVETLIESARDFLEIAEDKLKQALMAELEAGLVKQAKVGETPCIFLLPLYQAEKNIAFLIKKLNTASLPYAPFDIEEAIQWVEDLNQISLSSSQRQALKNTLTHKVTIITGGPGVGKTTLLQSVIEILKTKKMRFSLCAPTGRAAKRMTEATGIEAKTIHRLLNVNPITSIFCHNESDPLKCDVVVVDEVSMVDVPLMQALLKAIPPEALVIFVGDKDQLPSVGPGQVLADLIRSKQISCVHLTETFRQAATSNIIQIAQCINRGEMPPLKGLGSTSDFYFLETLESEDALTTVVDLVKNRLPKKFGVDPKQGIQVLSPMTRGLLGTKNLNVELQKALNPPSSRSILKYGSHYSVGDKVIQIENNYQKDVYNGDIGTIQAVNKEENAIVINFDNRELLYDVAEMDEINLAYAMTIHKSQGSEYPIVIIPLLMQHYPMLKRNLVYTGITRGKQIVILVGQPKAVALAAGDQQEYKRWSLLETHMRAAISQPIDTY